MTDNNEIYKILCEIKNDVGELKGEFKSHVEADKEVAKDVKETKEQISKWKWGIAGAIALSGLAHVPDVWGSIKVFFTGQL